MQLDTFFINILFSMILTKMVGIGSYLGLYFIKYGTSFSKN